MVRKLARVRVFMVEKNEMVWGFRMVREYRVLILKWGGNLHK